MKALYISLAAIALGAMATGARKTSPQPKGAPAPALELPAKENTDSIDAIMAKAEDGDPEAMNEVGLWYYDGIHVDRDYARAFDWWKKASLKKDARAIANLGRCYQYGHGVERDSVDAIRLYSKSIKEGNIMLLEQRVDSAPKNTFDAMLAGHCYQEAFGVRRDWAKAAEYYSMAADMGSVDGMRLAGVALLNCNKNEQAFKYFKMGARHDDLTCLFWAGKMLLGDMEIPEDKEQAVVFLLKAAEGGMPAAQTEMGYLYAEGNGVAKNLTQAAQWYRKAALQGHARGMWAYGHALKDGYGTDRNYSQALFWMARAADKGFQRGFKKEMARLDSIGNDPFVNYVRGMKLHLVDGNFTEAAKEFKKVEKANIEEGKIMQAVLLAAKDNPKANPKKAVKELEKLAGSSPEAASLLAVLYEMGRGVDQNSEKAIELMSSAADKDYGVAQCYLADIYYEGRGTEKDLEKAVDLYLKAKANQCLSRVGAVRLAECYEKGLGGLPQDPKMAKEISEDNFEENITNLLKHSEL